jgi:hypothetical protein
MAIAAVAVGLPAVYSSVASAATSSITDKLSTNKTSVEVASLPAGTQLVKVAVMKNTSGEGVTYKLIPVTQVSFAPPAGYPVVDMQAATSKGSSIGNWAGRIQTSTTPSEESKTDREARELKERESKEKTEREAGEKSEGPAEPPQSAMWVGLDAGGWNWASALKDVSGAVKYLRASYTYYNSEANVKLLSEDHLTLLPLFGTGGSIGGINATEYAQTLVTWFKRYGHGGTFWAGRTDYGAKTAELLNEPGGSWFWSDPTNYTAYAALARTVHAALEANFAPAVRPALLCSYDGGAGSSAWGRALFKAVPEVAKNCDALDVHPYGGHGSTSAQGRRASITEAHGDTGKPVYVTEVGWPTAVGQEPTGDSLQWTEEQQAANIRSFVVWARSLGYVNAVINFNYVDYGTNAFYGIVKSNGTTHKLSYSTMQSLTAEG